MKYKYIFLFILLSCDITKLNYPLDIENKFPNEIFVEACDYSNKCSFVHNYKFDLYKNAKYGIVYSPVKILNFYDNKYNLLYSYTNEELKNIKISAGYSLSSKNICATVTKNGLMIND